MKQEQLHILSLVVFVDFFRELQCGLKPVFNKIVMSYLSLAKGAELERAEYKDKELEGEESMEHNPRE